MKFLARNVVHRDVKGDNYLMDRKAREYFPTLSFECWVLQVMNPSGNRQNMTDKQCKVVLTDFGTARSPYWR